MTVEELIKELQKFPGNYKIEIYAFNDVTWPFAIDMVEDDDQTVLIHC
jgi:hypothetical protein